MSWLSANNLHSLTYLFFFFPAELVKEMESVVPHIVELFKDTDSWVSHLAVIAFSEISEHRK